MGFLLKCDLGMTIFRRRICGTQVKWLEPDACSNENQKQLW